MSQQPVLEDYFTDNALGNPLAIVQHPAGIHHQGITYVSYQGPDVAPYVAAYDHLNGTWAGPFKVGNSDLAALIKERNKIDSHGKPTMLMDDLGYIHIFYGGHGAGSKYGENPYGRGGIGRNKHAVSKRPFDITEWQDLGNISIYGTYNQALKMDNGDIYLIYRHGAHRSDWVYQKSTDHGRTFEPAVSFLKTKLRTDIKAADSWYVWANKGEGDDIILAFDYHVCWLRYQGPPGRGHVTQRHDLYYMVLNTKTGMFRNISGEQLSFPVTKEYADEKALVAQTGDNYWTFMGTTHLDTDGYPHMAINIGKDIGLNTGGPKQTVHYQWNGSEWVGGQLIRPQSRLEGTDTRGDFTFSTNDQHITYLLAYQERQQQGNTVDGVVAMFTSRDKANSFQKHKELLRRPNASWAVTARIANAHPDAQVLVAEKLKGQKYHKLFLLGENGPIKRALSATSL